MNHNEDFLKLVNNAKQHVKEIEANRLHQKLSENPQLKIIDVREPEEWALGHLDQAIALPRGILERDIEKVIPEKSTPIAVYCSGGYRSVLACDSLMKMGYQNCESLQGGLKDWINKGLPIKQD